MVRHTQLTRCLGWIWYFYPSTESFPRIWVRQMLLFDDVEGIIAECKQNVPNKTAFCN